MSDTLKEIILDFQEVELATGIPRRLEVTAMPGKTRPSINTWDLWARLSIAWF